MYISIKRKLILVISFLLVLSMGISGFLLINEKKKEIKNDIWKNGIRFSRLVTTPIISAKQLYFDSDSFLFFDREMQDVRSLNEDVTRIRIADYNGNILYDSDNKLDNQVEGKKIDNETKKILDKVENNTKETTEEETTKEPVKRKPIKRKPIKRKPIKEKVETQSFSENVVLDNDSKKILEDVKIGIKTDERVLFIKKNREGKDEFVNSQNRKVEVLSTSEEIQEIYYPANNNLRVIYSISYKFLTERINKSVREIIIIFFVILIIGLIMADSFAKRIVKPILILIGGAKKIAKGNLDVNVKVDTRDEIKTLADTFNKMVVDLNEDTKIKLEHERITKELDIAKDIQMGQIPKKSPAIDGLEIDVSLVTASEIGGDCYDFLKLEDGNYFFYVGDATGHGVPASLVVALSNAAIFGTSLKTFDPKKIIDDANIIVNTKTEPTMFLTMVGFLWNTKEQKMQFVQAGHDPVMLYSKKEQKVKMLPHGGTALGILPNISKITKTLPVEMDSGDVIFAYTDGFPEAFSKSNEILGMEKFKEIIEKNANKSSIIEIKNAIIDDVKDFMKGEPAHDDMTIILIKKK